MYNGIGLQTLRGSGTNGYTQSNKFFVKPKTNKVLLDGGKGYKAGQRTAGVWRKANQGYTDAEITVKLEEARRNLEALDQFLFMN